MISKLLIHVDDEGFTRRAPFQEAFDEAKGKEQGIQLLGLDSPHEMHKAVTAQLSKSDGDKVDLAVVSDVNMPAGGFPGLFLELQKIYKTARDKINSLKLYIYSSESLGTGAEQAQNLDQDDFDQCADIFPADIPIAELCKNRRGIVDVGKEIVSRLQDKIQIFNANSKPPHQIVPEIMRQLLGAQS